MCDVGFQSCCSCLKETHQMVSEWERFLWHCLLFCLSDFTQWGFDSTTWKRIVSLNFRWSCYYPERKPDFEMYSSWDSEHYGFPKNCMVDFMVRCINDNRKLCKNRSMHKQQEQNLFWNKASKSNFTILNNHKNDILCSYKFTREKDQSFDYW